MKLPRRKFLKTVGGLLVPAYVRGQDFGGYGDLPFFGSGSAAAASNSLLTGLSAYWTLDSKTGGGTLFPDSTANGLNLTIGGPGNLTTGLISFGYVGANTTDFLSHIDTALLSGGGTQQFTFQLWVKFSDNTFDYIIGGKWDTSSALLKDFCFYNDQAGAGGHYNFYATNAAATTTFIASTITTQNGVWNHLCGGFDGSNIWIQVDAETRQTLAKSDVRRTAAAFAIGNSNNLFRAVPGTIDECGFWQRTLTSAEVTTLYNGRAGKAFSTF